ncbi:MAG TPA: hypothetical protein VL171_14360 [Verrucomicrobiae bacterium]|nr:hypothetical protein [Verrucomicrobiae bacterium]
MRTKTGLRRLFFSNIWRVQMALAASLFFLVLPSRAQLSLNPGDTVNLSQLVGPGSASIQVGDKLFSDFGIPGTEVPVNSVNVTALSNLFGYGISFSSSQFAAIGNTTNDIILEYSVTVTDPQRLISDVHLSYNGSNAGSGFSHLTEEIFTGGFGGQKIAQLDVLNPGNPNPIFQNSVNLVPTRETLFIQKDLYLFGGGSSSGLNYALVSIVDQTFSEIPEPSALLLAGIGFLALLTWEHLKRTAAR